MFKPKFFIAAIAVSLFATKVHAQVDTTDLDLGHILLKKDFTQSITVKGDDLQKMPFENLSDAINVWFYGNYTNAATVVYVIDGNLANDVNAYSIYDIDEVTLVQNAISKLNGAVGPQQLILIKTKRAKSKGVGITAAGQANVSSLYTNNILNTSTNNNTYQTGQKTTTTVYQQYYLSAYKNTGTLNFGISADYMHDALPVITQTGITYSTPQKLDRFKFNGYFTAKLGASVLDITGGYVPQVYNYDEQNKQNTQYQADINDNAKEHIWNSAIKLTTPILPGFTNVLHGDYNYYGEHFQSSELDIYSNGNSNNEYNYTVDDHDIVLYDNLSYEVKFGNWSLEPAVNLTFRTFRDSSTDKGTTLDSYGDPIGYSSFVSGDHEHRFLLTPSVNLYYKSYFNIQAGIMDNLATIGEYYPIDPKYKKVLPFVTASADVTKLVDPNSSFTVKLFGSYSLAGFTTDNFNLFPNLSSYSVQLPVLGSLNNSLTSSYYPYNGSLYNYNGQYAVQAPNTDKTFKTISAGLSVSPLKSGLTINYFFEKANYISAVYEYAPAYGNGVESLLEFDNTNSILNSLTVNYNLVNTSAFNWQTNLSATMLKQSYTVFYGPTPNIGSGVWTGGWANRIKYHNLFAGADLLYQIGEKVYTQSYYSSTVSVTKVNSFSLQNLYVGYTIKTAYFKDLELFANGRNIFQNQKEDITDSRKYYGLGFRLSL
jgi:hypothetical protein